MRVRTLVAAAVAAFALGGAEAAQAPTIPSHTWSFDGIFGTFDRNALRRGFQVYSQVCASCHGLRLVAYRNLQEVGFSEDEVREIAAALEVLDGPDEAGDMFQRLGRPADRFVSPFANERAARAANNGAYPTDLSVITKARKGGANYIHALLTGYVEPPPGFEVMDGMHYNAVFPGHQIAMPAPLAEGAVDYPEGVEASIAQMSHDVTTFLAWAAEPELEARKRMGVKVLLFLIVLTGMFYALKRQIWAKLH